MKASLTSAVLIALCGSAFAQSAPAAAPAPAPVPAAAPSVVVVNSSPAPAADANVRLQLSSEDMELIQDGEIGAGAHIIGSGAAFFLGFGIGQAIEGRWLDRGWIFTLGETASLGVMIYGLGKSAESCLNEDGSSCGSSGVGFVAGGLIAYSGLRLWEVVDAIVAPIGHNRRVRGAQMRAGMRYSQVTPYLVPPSHGDGAIGGLSLRF
jgi:hypothetical protein